MNKKEVIVIGASDCFELIEMQGDHSITGYLAPQECAESSYQKYEYLGNDGKIAEYAQKGYVFFMAIADNKRRGVLFEIIKEASGEVLTFKHSSSVVYPSASIGEGTVVSPQSVVSSMAKIGRSVMVNYLSLVGHDVKIGDFSFVAPGVKILNGVKIGDHVMIGANATIAPGLTLGNNVKISANTFVSKNVPDNITVMNSTKNRRINL